MNKIKVFLLLTVMITGGQYFDVFGQTQGQPTGAKLSFVCSTFGMVVTHNAYPDATHTTFSRITFNSATSPWTVVDHPICTIPYIVNATAYNPADGFIYAFVVSSSTQFLRIDSLGNFDVLTAVADPDAQGSAYKGACCNTNNFLYLTANGATDNQIFYIDLSAPLTTGTNAGKYPIITMTPNLSFQTGLPDIVWNPANNTIYGVEGGGATVNGQNGKVVKIALSADGKTITSSSRLALPTGTTGNDTDANYSFAGVYINFDGSSNIGSMYGISNNDFSLWNYSLETGQRTHITKAMAVTANDAASCPYLQSDISVTKRDSLIGLWPGEKAHYTVVVSNLGPAIVYNMNIVDSVPAGIPPTNITYTAAVTGGATTMVVGQQNGAINDIISLSPGETVTYRVDLIVPSNYDKSTNGGLLVNKVRAIPDKLTVDPNLLNNSDYDADRVALPILPVNPDVRIDIHK